MDALESSWATSLALFSIFLTLLYWYFIITFDYWKKQGVPGDKPKLIWGTFQPLWRKRILDQDLEGFKKYGRVYGGFEGTRRILVVSDPDLVKQITVKDFSCFPNRRKFETVDKKIFDKMVSNMEGDEWKETRNILSPTFTTGKLKQMIGLIEECISSSLPSLEKFEGEPFEIKNWSLILSAKIIGSCAFGMKMKSLEDPNNDFLKQIQKVFNPPNTVIYFQLLWPNVFKHLARFYNPLNYFTELARKTLETRIKNEKAARKDLLQVLLEARKEENEGNEPNKKKVLTFDVITAQVALFLVAGHEAVANAIAFMTYCLATNPDIQEKLIQEIDDVVTERNGKMDYDSIMTMKYLEMVLSETLRIYPPGTRLERECSQDGYKLNDITLEKGIIVAIPVYTMHHNSEFFPDPEKFDPERFSPENKAKMNPYTFLPFGIGPRNCLAMRFAIMEIKVIMATLLSQFRFRTCAKTEYPINTGPGGFGFLQATSVFLVAQKRIDQPHFP